MLLCWLLGLGALLGSSSAQFGITLKAKDIVRSFRVLTGKDFLSTVHDYCREPITQFGYCFVGKDEKGDDVRPDDKLGRKLWEKTEKKLENFRESKEAQILAEMIDDVDKCFVEKGKCPLKPLDAVKCFLDFVIHGGPYDRVSGCIKSHWKTPDLDVTIPEFADLSNLEADFRLFASVGFYKRYRKGRRRFWRQYNNQLDVLCKPGGKPAVVRKCAEKAVKEGEKKNGGPLKLNLEKYFGAGGGAVDVEVSKETEDKMKAFGDQKDVRSLIRLLMDRVVACSFDIYGGMPAALRSIRENDPCLTPICVHYLWTVKEALCVDCRTSLSKKGHDAFAGKRKFFAFLRSVAVEYKKTASQGYDCELEPPACQQCQKSAKHWKAEKTNLLKGFGKEAGSAVKILKKFCGIGSGPDSPAPVGPDTCPMRWPEGDFNIPPPQDEK